jgi:hypothetical protein
MIIFDKKQIEDNIKLYSVLVNNLTPDPKVAVQMHNLLQSLREFITFEILSREFQWFSGRLFLL